jgi:hypothetical protein
VSKKRRKNVIARFKEHSPNKFHGVPLVYFRVTCATFAAVEECSGVSQRMYTGFGWESLKERDRLLKDKCRWVDNIEMHFIN